DQRIPLDFSSDDVSASLDYSFLHFRYSGNLVVGRVENQFAGMRPIAWTARANFTFDRNGIQVQSLKVVSEHSQLLASGVNLEFHDLNARGNYQLNLDLAQLAAVTRGQEVKNGTLELKGNGSWSQQGFASAGTFVGRDLA